MSIFDAKHFLTLKSLKIELHLVPHTYNFSHYQIKRLNKNVTTQGHSNFNKGAIPKKMNN